MGNVGFYNNCFFFTHLAEQKAIDKQQQKETFSLPIDGVWSLEYLWATLLPHIVKLEFGKTRVEIYIGREAQIAKDLHTDHH